MKHKKVQSFGTPTIPDSNGVCFWNFYAMSAVTFRNKGRKGQTLVLLNLFLKMSVEPLRPNGVDVAVIVSYTEAASYKCQQIASIWSV